MLPQLINVVRNLYSSVAKTMVIWWLTPSCDCEPNWRTGVATYVLIIFTSIEVKRGFRGGPEVVTPIHMAAIRVFTELRYMAKLKYRQNQHKVSKYILGGDVMYSDLTKSCTFGILWICCKSTATLTLFLSFSVRLHPPCLIDAVSSCIHRHLCEHLKKQVGSLRSAKFLQSISTWKVCYWTRFLFRSFLISEYRTFFRNHWKKTCPSDHVSKNTYTSLIFFKAMAHGLVSSTNRAAISN